VTFRHCEVACFLDHVKPLLFSPLSSSFSSLAWRRSLQQRSAPPPGHAPPVLKTRERPCPHCPCLERENGRARSTCAGDQRAGPGPVGLNAKLRQSAMPGWARSVEISSSGNAGPGPIGCLWRTRAPSRTDVVKLYIRCVCIKFEN
jgi:hypothetical protein